MTRVDQGQRSGTSTKRVHGTRVEFWWDRVSPGQRSIINTWRVRVTRVDQGQRSGTSRSTLRKNSKKNIFFMENVLREAIVAQLATGMTIT